MCPNRSQVIKSIISEETNYEETIFLTKMGEYTSKLKHNVTAINEFYKEHDLESRIKM